VLNPNKPITVSEDASLSEVVSKLQSCRIGGVLVVDGAGRLTGVFTERDCVQKILGREIDLASARVVDYMTKDPVAQPPDITTAYALNLMSHGGFRHLPLVDQDQIPIGIVSVKDVLDYIVNTFILDLLEFPNLELADESSGNP
jgi:CBS domain-containing protein